MEFLTIREFSKAPKIALSKLARDGKAVLTNNGKPAAIMLNVDTENFERVFGLVQKIGMYDTAAGITYPAANDGERSKAIERLMEFPRKKIPLDFDHKKELMGAIDERFDCAD